jgi:hypothetical protein
MTEITNVYGHPAIYPNSENIKPPLEKERLRVVEAATRTELELNQIKEIEERVEEINILRQQAIARYDPNGNAVPIAYTEGEFVNIEV